MITAYFFLFLAQINLQTGGEGSPITKVQAKAPIPIDAFKTNWTSTKASLEFTYVTDLRDWNSIKKQLEEHQPGFKPIVNPKFLVAGEWESDGQTERFEIYDKQALRQSPIASNAPGHAEEHPYEALFNGSTFAFHRFENTKKFLDVRKTDTSPVSLFGPFEWWQTNFFQVIKTEYSKVDPTVENEIINNQKVVTEIYQLITPEGWNQLEVSYLPEMGYLPKRSRIIGFARKSLVTPVREYYLLDAKPCLAGGFVPTDYVDVTIQSKEIHDNYKSRMALSPNDKVYVGHFKADRFKEQSEEVRIKRTENINVMMTPSGPAKLPEKPTMKEIESSASRLLDRAANPASTIINTNSAKADDDKKQYVVVNVLIMTGCIVPVLLFLTAYFFHKKSTKLFSVIFLLVLAVGGCDKSDSKSSVPQSKTVLTLSTDVVPNVIFANPETAFVNSTVEIKNHSLSDFKIISLDAGCSCRNTDRSSLPIVLQPGKLVELPITIQNKNSLDKQDFVFTIETDQGRIMCPSSYTILTSSSTSPDSIALSVYTNSPEEDFSFEFIHRMIFGANQEISSIDFKISDDLERMNAPSLKSSHQLNFDLNYKLQEEKFKFLIKNKSVGYHKTTIDVLDSSSKKKLCSLPVAWNCIPFVSMTPERVFLGNTRARLFLRCPDPTIEIDSVLSCSQGISAVLASERELQIFRSEGFVDEMDGLVEVTTNDKNHSVIKIQVHCDKKR